MADAFVSAVGSWLGRWVSATEGMETDVSDCRFKMVPGLALGAAFHIYAADEYPLKADEIELVGKMVFKAITEAEKEL